MGRGYDWGSSRPYAALWFALSDGETPATIKGEEIVFPKESLFVIAEYYGWNGRPNEGRTEASKTQAEKILSFQKTLPFADRVAKGPADRNIWAYNRDSRTSIANDHKEVGLDWTRGNQVSGSRIAGANLFRKMLLAATIGPPPEDAGIYFFNTCGQAIRTIPFLPADPSKDGDVDTTSEDHLWDVVRMRLLADKVLKK